MIRQFTISFRLLSFFLLLDIYANSQKNFKDGYVVLKTGDTLRGKIDYRAWEVNPLKIQFQRADAVTSYTPTDLRSFEVSAADVYISSVVTKDTRPVDISVLTSGISISDTMVTDTVFLRRLTHGTRLSLYQLVDGKEHYYIQQGPDEKMEELVYTKKIEEKTSRIDVQSKYKNQLARFIAGSDDPAAVLGKINNSNYTEKDLVHIARLLNGETITATKNNKDAKQNHMLVMAGGGITYFNFKFSGSLDKYTRIKFPAAFGPVAALAIDIAGSRNLRQLVLRLGMSYSHLVYKGELVADDLLSHQTQYNYDITQNCFTPELSVLYNFVIQKNFRMYGGLGVGFVFSAYPVNQYRAKRLSNGDETVEDNPLKMEKLWLSPAVMAGARVWNKVNINLETKLGGGFINYNQVRGSFFPLTCTVSYIFISEK